MNIFLFLSIVLAFSLLFGRVLEKIRIPWVFASLFLGLFLSSNTFSKEMASSETFVFLAELGMYFLLFIIGLEINLKEMLKQGKFIARLSFLLVLAESFFGSLFVHYFFDTSWGISLLVASSFATVGEAILIPILDEFKITKTRFGQIILGIGTLDDVVEIVTVIVASIVLGSTFGHGSVFLIGNFFLLMFLFLFPLFLQVFDIKIPHFKFKKIPPLFLFCLMILFVFVGIGSFVESAALGAIFAGISLRSFLSRGRIRQVEKIIRIVSYGFFVPIFFLHVGIGVDVNYLLAMPVLILCALLITNTTKIAISYFCARNYLGGKKSILLGIGLSAKFSTSIVIISMLFHQELISSELYSVLVGAMIASKFIIPVAFSFLLKKWALEFKKVGKN